MADVALVAGGILLVVLGLGRVAELDGEVSDLAEPGTVVVRGVVALEVSPEDLLPVRGRLGRPLALVLEALVEEVLYEWRGR